MLLELARTDHGKHWTAVESAIRRQSPTSQNALRVLQDSNGDRFQARQLRITIHSAGREAGLRSGETSLALQVEFGPAQTPTEPLPLQAAKHRGRSL